MKEMLTNAQKTLIGKGLQSGKGIVLNQQKGKFTEVFWELWLQLEFPWQLNLLQKYLEAALGKGCKLLEKLGEKDCKLLEKAGTGVGQGLQVSQKPFLWQPPPSMVHGRGRDAEQREKDFYWGTTAHSTTSPSWEQFFRAKPGALCAKGEAKMERYSPVKF